MSCYAKHPDVKGIECWHGPGHAGDHGKEGRRWPNADDPLQVELMALRKVADAAAALVLHALIGDGDMYQRDMPHYDALFNALMDAGR